jgi:signal transduction histidine kinase
MIVIESSKLFGGLSQSDQELLQNSVQLREYAHQDIIFKEGDRGDGMYVVRAGLVQISALIANGDRKPLARLAPGEYFGEMAVIDNEPRSASASAEGPTTVYYLPRESVLKLLEQSPLLAVRLVREFSHRMREFNKHYVEEAIQSERLTLVGRFARSIVHDFKNPLNVIGLAAELAGLERSTPTMRSNASARIRKQVDRLSNMINELLEFTRGQQNEIVLATTNYPKFIHQVLEEIRPEVAEKKVEIVADEPPDVDLLLDPQRLTHVFFNLIHNSCDAMPEGGKIYIRFRRLMNELITEIEDTGKGFAPEIANRLFEAFATFGKATGTGLGLSICKKIIADHKGHIEAHKFPNRGAVFTFALPIPQKSPE